MKLVAIDFETHYSDDFSLSKMQTDGYVLDPQFEVIGIGAKVDDGPTSWRSGDDDFLRKQLGKPEWWADVAVLCHNCHFDGFILAQKFGIKPRLWIDTLAMGRALYPYLPSHSLSSLAAYLGVGTKGDEVIAAKGKRRADFTPEELARYGEYCKNDVEITKAIYDIMAPSFPLLEFSLVDTTVRMFTEPRFQLDAQKIVTYRDGIITEKAALLAGAETPGTILSDTSLKDTIMSNPKFAGELEKRGVIPPTKISKTTGKVAYAFAKTDKGLTDLLEHPDTAVQTLVAARLGNKTTLAETRAQKLIETAERGVGFPIYLNFWGAKTTGRFSGGNGVNAQNFPSRGKDRVLREAMLAPPGHVVVVGDSANIELRVNFALSGQTDLLDKIREYDAQGDAATSDLYCDFASVLFGHAVSKGDKQERTVGKIAELGLGYGCSAGPLQQMFRVQAKIDYPVERCEQIVGLYRETHGKVKKLWDHFGYHVIPWIANKDVMQGVDVNGWFLTTHEGFSLPGHLGVMYHDLKRNSDNEWDYQQGRMRYKLYGSKGVENLAQHAARHIVMWQTARVARRYPVVLSVHDEIVGIVPEEQGEECAAYMLESLRLAPQWCRGAIPLNGEVGVGRNYGAAKG